MKPVLAWIKANPLIVVFSALILVLLPTSWFVSSWWSTKIKTNQETLANKDMKVLQAAKIDYVLQQVDPASPGVTHKDYPNKELIAWFKDQRDALKSQADSLVKRAEDFNKGVGADAQAVGRTEHKPLVDGLFPPPKNRDEEQNKLNEMEDALLGNRGRPNPYQQLLDRARAGGPADPVRMAEVITDMQGREKEKITANKRDLTSEEQSALQKQLADRRLAEYQSRASEISVYASLDSFPHGRGFGTIPTGAHLDPTLIDPFHFFMYQWDYWVFQDLIAAVRLANTDANGRLTNVDSSVVKRIVSMELLPPDGVTPRESSQGGMNAAPPPAPAAPGMAPLDPTVSVSGRAGSEGNSVYDVRRVRMTVIVSSAHLQDFLEAIPRTNFMTVTDLDLAEVNAWDDLKHGYYYGPENVVRATVGIETVWLRSWTSGYMPSQLKSALHIPDPAAGEGAPAEQTNNNRGPG